MNLWDKAGFKKVGINFIISHVMILLGFLIPVILGSKDYYLIIFLGLYLFVCLALFPFLNLKDLNRKMWVKVSISLGLALFHIIFVMTMARMGTHSVATIFLTPILYFILNYIFYIKAKG